MSQTMLSDEALKQAAASVRQSLLNSLPPPSQCEHEFSPAFQAKIKKLTAKFNLRRTIRKTAQRAAAIFLAALIGISGWLTLDAEAREAFFSWAREVYEEHIVYRFFGEPAADTLPTYRITWLPEGYAEIDVYDGETLFNAFYQKGDDIMSAFVFEYLFIQDGGYTNIMADAANYTHKTVSINGIQADFYQASNPAETNNLIWIDENAGIVFQFNGFLNETVMVHIAESIIFTNSTK